MSNFLTRKQTEVMLSPKKRINLYYGSVRSGKTHFSVIEFALFVLSFPVGSEFLMVGKTLTTLNRNCLRLLQEFEPKFTYTVSGKKGNLLGRVIWLEGANDNSSENKIRGMTLQGAYIDELTLSPESFYSMLLTRLSLKGAKLFATTNPDSPSHYVYTDIIKNENIDKRIVKFTLDDNDFLDPEYVRNLKAEFTGVFYERFILGNFVRAEGIIYQDFANNTDNYLIDEKDIRDIQRIVIGVDYGASASKTVFKAVGFSNNYKDIIVLAECDLKGLHSPELMYAKFEEFLNIIQSKFGGVRDVFADWGGLGDVITSGLIDYCQRRKLKVQIQNAEKGKILDRIQLTTQLMAQGRLKVNRNCKNIILAFQDAVWDEKNENTRLDDGTSDVDSLDAFEYAIYPFTNYLIKRR